MTPQDPSASLTEAEHNERILNAVAASRWPGRLLAGLALAFGFLSIAASLATVMGYLVLYRPKENQLLMDYRDIVRQTGPGAPADNHGMAETHDGRRFDPLGLQLGFSHAIAFGVALIAVSVALLGTGTLVTIMLVTFHRRTTLRQVNASLAQISGQLRALRHSGQERLKADG